MRGVGDVAVDAFTVRVHRDRERAEIADAKFPQTLGHQIFEIDVLDRFDLFGLNRCGAADDREIDAAKRCERRLDASERPPLPITARTPHSL